MAGLDLHWTCVKHNTMYVSVNWSLVQINISFLVSWVIVTQLCPTLCNSMDCSLPSSSVHGILQARILECVAILFSRGSSWPRDQTGVSCIAGRFFTTDLAGKQSVTSLVFCFTVCFVLPFLYLSPQLQSLWRQGPYTVQHWIHHCLSLSCTSRCSTFKQQKPKNLSD